MIIAWNAPARWAATYCGMNPSFCGFHSLGGRAPVANQPRNPTNHMGSTICQWIQIDALHKTQLYSWVVGRIWNVWNCLLPLQKWNHPFLGSGRKQLPTSGASEAVWKLYQFSENLTFSRISQHDASFDLEVRLERITKSPEPGQHQIAVSLKNCEARPLTHLAASVQFSPPLQNPNYPGPRSSRVIEKSSTLTAKDVCPGASALVIWAANDQSQGFAEQRRRASKVAPERDWCRQVLDGFLMT